MKQVWTYNLMEVIIENGKVTHSDTELCEVGKKPNLKALRACGWLKQKAIKQYYAKGTDGNMFSK